uniref:Sfi1 spindle body domain-containing protein n=1 Tax=Mycena chlorophos TaxID=658473 RepID=A0ABQ0L2N1_MYCCL|nr:predicted protein [Mycena chlorophos]
MSAFEDINRVIFPAQARADALDRALRRQRMKPALATLLRRQTGAWSPVTRAARQYSRRWRAHRLKVLKAKWEKVERVLLRHWKAAIAAAEKRKGYERLQERARRGTLVLGYTKRYVENAQAQSVDDQREVIRGWFSTMARIDVILQDDVGFE